MCVLIDRVGPFHCVSCLHILFFSFSFNRRSNQITRRRNWGQSYSVRVPDASQSLPLTYTCSICTAIIAFSRQSRSLLACEDFQGTILISFFLSSVVIAESGVLSTSFVAWNILMSFGSGESLLFCSSEILYRFAFYILHVIKLWSSSI